MRTCTNGSAQLSPSPYGSHGGGQLLRVGHSGFKSDHRSLQTVLKKLEEWARSLGNEIQRPKVLHTEHTEQIDAPRRTGQPDLLTSSLQSIPQHRLGADLKWTTHIRCLRRNANSILGFIRKNLQLILP